jgi:hypothetical protein
MNADRIALIVVSAIAVLSAFHNYIGANAQTPQSPLRVSLSSSFVGVQATMNGNPGAGVWLIGSDLTRRDNQKNQRLRIASLGVLPCNNPLPHLICSPAAYIGGGQTWGGSAWRHETNWWLRYRRVTR